MTGRCQDDLDRVQSGGCVCGNVCGSYIHGLFDLAEAREALISALCEKRGIRPLDVKTVDYRIYKEEQYRKLAEGLRGSLDMERIYEILWTGIG
jgi:adenosylcobyric acid synthase